jgi:hypothetical protein
MADLLHVTLRDLERGLANWQDLVNPPDGFDMTLLFLDS